MLGLGQTTAKLAEYRRKWENLLASAKGADAAGVEPRRSFPRTRGDRPVPGYRGTAYLVSSPHARG